MSNKCCVKDCPAGRGGDLTYFSLPAGYERRLQWLKAIGKPHAIQDSVIHNYVVCSIHFDKSQIDVQKQIYLDAVPTRHIPSKRKGVHIHISNTASQTDFPSSDDDDDYNKTGNKRKIEYEGNVVVYKRLRPNRKMYACIVIDSDRVITDDQPIVDMPPILLKPSIHAPRDDISLGNRKIFVFSEDENVVIDKREPVSNRVVKPNNGGNDIVINDVFSLKENEELKKFDEWRHGTVDRLKEAKRERDFKIFALNLHSINTRAYRLLMESWQLPKEKELKEIQLNIGPVFDERMTKLLSHKFKTLSKKGQFCTLGLYIMPLKAHLFYDPANDEIIGVHNVNVSKKIEAANYALVAMARGLKVPWCQPVAFSLFSTMTDADNIDFFITNTITKLRKMGLKILGVVMDENPYFWRYCRSAHYITVNNPYLNIDKEQVFVIFDLPHILSLFREEFMNNDFTFEKKTISWNYLKQVYDVDKERGSRLLPQLNDDHMKLCNTEKNVKNTREVFSRTVAGAINYYINLGLLPKEAAPTAELLKKISDAFDVLNADKRVHGIKNTDSQTKLASAQTKALDAGVSLAKKIAGLNKDDKSKEADSLKYFSITFKSLLLISFILKEATQIGITQTSLCYLEPIEEFIKAIKKDAKDKPTPIQFTRKFSKLFLKYLVDFTPPPTSVGSMADFLKMADGVKDSDKTYDDKRIIIKDREYRFCLPETYAIIYVSSFLLYKCSEKHMCKAFENFLDGLVDLKKTKVYVHFEKYNKDAVFYDILKLPPIELPAFVERLDNCFLKCFAECYHSKPAETIYSALTKVSPWDPPCPCFPFDYMLKLFVRTRIYQTVSHNTRCLKNKSVETYSIEANKL